ncbi:MAG: hypothetical protein M5U34_43815 [Chloroflexi bacterium]|nr:hypothetical protein [Chloroflexota bacterium]
MTQRKLLLLALILLLLSVGLVGAQSSMNFVNHRFVLVGGDSASSAHYQVVLCFWAAGHRCGQQCKLCRLGRLFASAAASV